MSRKNRPTAASWDSDEDLLHDDILGISAFQSSKEKEESDEELDEDALLGSDNEYSETTKESTVKAEKIPSTNAAGIPSQTSYQSHLKRRDELEMEEYELLEVPSDADFEGEDVIEVADPSELDGFETGQGNLTEDGNAEHFAASNISGQSISELGTESYNHPVNDYESFQSQEEDYEDKTIKGFEESSESEDEEKGRGRFISERSNIISIATTKPKTRTDIPDTLEISEEQQAQIDQFLNERNRRGGRRGYRGGHDNRVHARQATYNTWTSNTTASNMQPPSHLTDKRPGGYKVQSNPNITVAETEVYPITITGRGSYNQHHTANQPHLQQQQQQPQPQAQQQQPPPPQQHIYHHQQQHHHQQQQQHIPQQQHHHPQVPQHPPPSPNPASTPQVMHHPSHMYQQPQPQHPSVVTNQPQSAVPHHYTQPVSMTSSAPLAAPPSVVMAPTNSNPSQQQGRKILINPHFRGAKLESQPPPVIPSSSAIASTPMLQQPQQRHRHYQPVTQQTSYVQPNPAEAWPPAAAPQAPQQHSYAPNTQPMMHPQTHYTPVSQPYQAAPQPQSLQPPPPPPPPPPVQHQQMPAAPPMAAPIPSQINTVPPQYSGAPQPIQSLAPVPNQQPPSVYHISQPYQSAPAPVPSRPVNDQSMIFRQTSQSHLMPAPQAPHFMSSPPPPSPQVHQQHPLHPSQVHSVPQHQPGATAAPPMQQPFQPRPQYQVQPVQQSHHEMIPTQHQSQQDMSKNSHRMPAPITSQYGNSMQQIRTSTRGNFSGKISTFSKLHRKYQRVNPLVSPKRNRQEIQTQQNKNIKVLTTLPQVKLMSDTDTQATKMPKVSTHLKQLTQSDDEESKLLREKLEQQKRMRAEVIRRKELRRLLQAEQRRKDLQDKLAEQGLTLADVSEEQKAHLLDGLPKKKVGAVNKSLTSYQAQIPPGKKQQILGKRPLQSTPVADAAAKNASQHQFHGKPPKQVKTNVSGKQEKDKMLESRQQTNQALSERHQHQSAGNVILSEEEKNFYQKQYIPPHQQFQSISTPKKAKRDMISKESEQKAGNEHHGEHARGSNENLGTKINCPPGPGSGFVSPQQMPGLRHMRGGKMKMFNPRMQFGGQPRMPSPNAQAQMQNSNYEGQLLNFPPPSQGPQRPMGMRSPIRPGQNQGHLRPPIPVGMRQQAPGVFRHPSPSGMRPALRPGLRHFGPQSSLRPMRGQPRLLGPPNQSRMPQDQLRPMCPQQQRFMHPSNPQRHLIPQGRGGLRGMMSRGRGMQPGRGGHLMPMLPPQGSMPPDFAQQLEGNIPKQELMKKTRLILKKVIKNSVAGKGQAVANAKKVLVRKVSQSNLGGPAGGAPQNINNVGAQQGNRQMNLQGPNVFPNQERQMKFQNPGMGRGKIPPQRPPGPMPMRKVPGNMAVNKDQSNLGRRTDGDGNQKIKKATMIAVDNLSSSTTERTMHQMAKSCGHVESLQLLKSQRKALIRFRTGDQAQKFFKKFHRHMLDLSHINVTVLPAS
ncbi:RNA-binding protein 33-like isoform X2 [Octopus sinensis]|uniref:RNA-binding protein 33-like isoform X2 n=1 Tax=Octopus sinensis TaxID=2607531 RepID=A0A6P7SNX8_9MOLL|nr:RNA-binding protein 33-like isoform X2 [Octopus sinensis]